jgi:hypothetical protein
MFDCESGLPVLERNRSPSFLSPMKSLRCSFECLILAEIRNREAQRIYGDQLIGDFALKDKDKIRGIEVALDFAALRANIRETPVVPLINEQGEKEKERDEW